MDVQGFYKSLDAVKRINNFPKTFPASKLNLPGPGAIVRYPMGVALGSNLSLAVDGLKHVVT